MKTSLKLIAIAASLVSVNAFASNTFTAPVISLSAGAVAGTYASGAVTQDRHAGNYVTSGASVETQTGASVSYSHNSVAAGAASDTAGAAGGNGSAGYLGASGSIGTISVTPVYRNDR